MINFSYKNCNYYKDIEFVIINIRTLMIDSGAPWWPNYHNQNFESPLYYNLQYIWNCDKTVNTQSST